MKSLSQLRFRSREIIILHKLGEGDGSAARKQRSQRGPVPLDELHRTRVKIRKEFCQLLRRSKGAGWVHHHGRYRRNRHGVRGRQPTSQSLQKRVKHPIELHQGGFGIGRAAPVTDGLLQQTCRCLHLPGPEVRGHPLDRMGNPFGKGRIILTQRRTDFRTRRALLVSELTEQF